MGHKTGVSREQFNLFPEAFDDLIPATHPVRVIDAFVDGLDLQVLGFGKAIAKATGRPPYDPADLLKLYVYGYLNRITSSRRLETESGRNLELMWLLKRLQPDFKTIADFRRLEGGAIRNVCRAFVRFCQQAGILKGEVVAVDGSKFGASNSLARNVSRKRLERRLKRVDEKIAEYLKELDVQDAQATEAPLLEGAKTQEALETLKAKRDELTALVEQLEASGQSQVSFTDADSRRMKQTMGGGFLVGFNAQVAVDTDTHLVVCQEVVNEGNDRQQLHPMAERVQETLGSQPLTVVADAGYASAEQAALCEQSGITTCVPREHGTNHHGAFFDKREFVYEPSTDRYRCPAGQVLTYRGSHSGQRNYRTAACRTCPLKVQCTGGKRRTVTRSEHETAIEAMDQRARGNAELMQKRKCTVEHVFGTLKTTTGTRFLTRGLDRVGTELALSVLVYNLKRVMNLVGIEPLLTQLRT